MRPAVASKNKSWPRTMRLISTGPRRMVGSANKNAPRGRLPRLASRRWRPDLVLTGITVRANTQGLPLQSSCTSRIKPRCAGLSFSIRASSWRGRPHACRITRTRKVAPHTCFKRWVREVGSNSQPRNWSGMCKREIWSQGRQRGVRCAIGFGVWDDKAGVSI